MKTLKNITAGLEQGTKTQWSVIIFGFYTLSFILVLLDKDSRHVLGGVLWNLGLWVSAAVFFVEFVRSIQWVVQKNKKAWNSVAETIGFGLFVAGIWFFWQIVFFSIPF